MQQWKKVTKKSQIDTFLIIEISVFVLLGLVLLLFWNYQLKRQVAKKPTNSLNFLDFLMKM